MPLRRVTNQSTSPGPKIPTATRHHCTSASGPSRQTAAPRGVDSNTPRHTRLGTLFLLSSHHLPFLPCSFFPVLDRDSCSGRLVGSMPACLPAPSASSEPTRNRRVSHAPDTQSPMFTPPDKRDPLALSPSVPCVQHLGNRGVQVSVNSGLRYMNWPGQGFVGLSG